MAAEALGVGRAQSSTPRGGPRVQRERRDWGTRDQDATSAVRFSGASGHKGPAMHRVWTGWHPTWPWFPCKARGTSTGYASPWSCLVQPARGPGGLVRLGLSGVWRCLLLLWKRGRQGGLPPPRAASTPCHDRGDTGHYPSSVLAGSCDSHPPTHTGSGVSTAPSGSAWAIAWSPLDSHCVQAASARVWGAACDRTTRGPRALRGGGWALQSGHGPAT